MAPALRGIGCVGVPLPVGDDLQLITHALLQNVWDSRQSAVKPLTLYNRPRLWRSLKAAGAHGVRPYIGDVAACCCYCC